jgi:hypothetical protein
VVGPQGVKKVHQPAMRDLKREERRKATNLRTPDHV